LEVGGTRRKTRHEGRKEILKGRDIFSHGKIGMPKTLGSISENTKSKGGDPLGKKKGEGIGLKELTI